MHCQFTFYHLRCKTTSLSSVSVPWDSRDELFATDLLNPAKFLRGTPVSFLVSVLVSKKMLLECYPIIQLLILLTSNQLPYCPIVSKLTPVPYWRKCDWSTASLCNHLQIHHNDLFFICCCSSFRSLWRERGETALWPNTKETAGAQGTM